MIYSELPLRPPKRISPDLSEIPGLDPVPTFRCHLQSCPEGSAA